MQFTYKLKLPNIEKILTIPLEFTPYTNGIGSWNGSTSGWVSPDASMTVVVDSGRKILGVSTLNFVLNSSVQQGTIYKDVACSQNTYYMISAYVRNDGVLTTGLRVGSSTDWSSNYYTNRLIAVVNSGSNTTLRVNLDMFYQSSTGRNAWVGGFFMTPITEGEASLTLEELSMKYQYTETSKASPSMKDLLAHKYLGSPFEYFLTMDGVRIANYNVPLST